MTWALYSIQKNQSPSRHATLRATLRGIASVGAGASPTSGSSEEDYDRFDGTGPSRLKVSVIEWGEKQLEVHVSPKGKLQGLSAKLDDRNTDAKVMVLGFRVPGVDRPVVRRAILGIPMSQRFYAYEDTQVQQYNKIILTSLPLDDAELSRGHLTRFTLAPPPAQLYPDGHPALSQPPQLAESPREPAVAGGPTVDVDTGTINGFEQWR